MVIVLVVLLVAAIFVMINNSTGRNHQEVRIYLKASARKLAALEISPETYKNHLPQSDKPDSEEIDSEKSPAFNETSSREGEEFTDLSVREGYRVVKEDENGMTLEIKVPEYELNSGEVGGEIYQTVSISGYSPREESGKPVLPVKIITIPLPAVESIEVRSASTDEEEIEGVNLFIPRSEKWRQEDAEAIWEERIISDPERYAGLSSRWKQFLDLKKEMRVSRADSAGGGWQQFSEIEENIYPGEILAAGSPYWKRDQQFVNLLISPFQYSGPSETLTFHSSILVDIQYGPAQPITAQEDLNPYKEQFKLARSDSFKVSVTSDGIHTLTYQNLLDAGFNMSGDPRSLKMYFLGEEIAIFIQGEEDGFWDPGDYLDFYGEKNTSFYSQTNIYWLYQDTNRGKRMEEISSAPCGRPARQTYFLSPKHLEEENWYSFASLVGEDGDCWFWDFAGVGWAMETEFQLLNVTDAERAVSFTGRFFGITALDPAPDHHTNVRLNGHLIGDFIWDGKVAYTLETDVPQAYFNEGTNILRVEEINDIGVAYDFIYVNNFEFGYYRDYACGDDALTFSASKKGDYLIADFSGEDIALYDVTDPRDPKRMIDFDIESGASYSIRFRKSESGSKDYVALRGIISSPGLEENQPSDLARARRVDYLVITHPDFSAAIQALVDFRDDRENGGLRADAFEIQDVYDTFSFGNFDPQAIRDFLKYTYYFWKQPAPSYVLLVGDGNYDYQNFEGTGAVNYIPPYLFQSNFMQTASDNWYACLVGDDKVPDMNIGRLCVETAGETNDHVQKIIDYENSTSGLPWQKDILMSADDPDVEAGNFPADSDWLIDNYIPALYSADTAYKPVLGAGTRMAVINAINAGRLIVNYLGHGSMDTWSALPAILSNGDLALFTNSDRLPLMTTMTCMNGYWCDLAGDCLAEAMTGAVGKGTVANMSPTGMCINSVSKQLVAYLFEELLINDQKKIGPAITEAKSRLYDVGSYEEIDLYHLFGDPALRLK